MLRAVGMTRWQARVMIGSESVITALIGAALGLPLGECSWRRWSRALSTSTRFAMRSHSARFALRAGRRARRPRRRDHAGPAGRSAERLAGTAVRVGNGHSGPTAACSGRSQVVRASSACTCPAGSPTATRSARSTWRRSTSRASRAGSTSSAATSATQPGRASSSRAPRSSSTPRLPCPSAAPAGRDPLRQRRGHRDAPRSRARGPCPPRRLHLDDGGLRRSRDPPDRRERPAPRSRALRTLEDRGRRGSPRVRAAGPGRGRHPPEDLHRPRAARRLRDPLRLDP